MGDHLRGRSPFNRGDISTGHHGQTSPNQPGGQFSAVERGSVSGALDRCACTAARRRWTTRTGPARRRRTPAAVDAFLGAFCARPDAFPALYHGETPAEREQREAEAQFFQRLADLARAGRLPTYDPRRRTRARTATPAEMPAWPRPVGVRATAIDVEPDDHSHVRIGIPGTGKTAQLGGA